MFARPDLDLTLGGLQTTLQERTADAKPERVSPADIKFHLDAATPVIQVGRHEVPATDTAVTAFTDLVQMPTAFYKRAADRVQMKVFNSFMQQMFDNTLSKDARVVFKGKPRGTRYLDSITEWGREPIEPLGVVNAAVSVVGEGAKVHRLVDNPGKFFGFDVHVLEDLYGDGGETVDTEGNKVNDVTAGGVRFGLDMKHGLAPSTEEILFRLACTNGMTIADPGLKVDARGQTVEEVLAELEGLAEIAFGRVEQSVKHFYDLRNQRVDNVERALRTLAREQGIPNRSLVALMDLAASEDVPDDASMFDVVNLVTNFANSPAIGRDGGRLILEGVGGSVVSQHTARCGHCQQKVTA